MTAPTTPVPTDAAPEVLAARLRLANARLARRVRQEALSGGDDLTASRLAALATIDALGPITLGELAAEEQVQPPSMTRIVARLEENGLAIREVDERDRRIVRVQITPAGRRTLETSRTRKAAFLAQRVARLSPEARAVLADALPVLEALIDD
ncbi:MAG TPA: MarR family transcriptional regulator [Acidimicrobiia bacterium]|nr:MarR family transcriptional regulator [Acidimicrobiia bacterium]